MPILSISVNYLAIVVAAIAAFVFGFLVHGPLFGKTWLKLMKITPAEMAKGKKEMQGKMHWYMLVALVQQLVIACVTAHLSAALGLLSWFDAVQLAFWVWLGYVAMVCLNGVLWEKRSLPLYLFNVAYHLASLIIISLIVTLWL